MDKRLSVSKSKNADKKTREKKRQEKGLSHDDNDIDNSFNFGGFTPPEN